MSASASREAHLAFMASHEGEDEEDAYDENTREVSCTRVVRLELPVETVATVMTVAMAMEKEKEKEKEKAMPMPMVSLVDADAVNAITVGERKRKCNDDYYQERTERRGRIRAIVLRWKLPTLWCGNYPSALFIQCSLLLHLLVSSS